MKYAIAFLAVLSAPAFATDFLNHATRGELKAEAATRAHADHYLQGQINQTRADGAAAIGQTNQAVKSVDDKVNNAISAQIGVNNEYGTRLDNQDLMNSQFAGDINSIKSQQAGFASELHKQGKRIGQVENGLAGVAALASIQFNTDPEAGFQVGCGVAQIRSNNGMSCGAGGALNKNWFVSGYVMQASSSSGVAASATYSFGR